MNISEIIELLAPKKKKLSLTGLHKGLKNLDESLLYHTLKGKEFPTFLQFRNTITGERRLFNISIGLLILNAFANNEMFDVDSVPTDYGVEEEYRNDYFFQKQFSLTKLHKEVKKIDISILDEILLGKPFPSFDKFRKSLFGADVRFSLYEGIIILKYYSEGRIYNLESKYIHQETINRAKNQANNLEIRDRDGLLGISIPRAKDYNKLKKETKIVRSVWTVKKK